MLSRADTQAMDMNTEAVPCRGGPQDQLFISILFM